MWWVVGDDWEETGRGEMCEGVFFEQEKSVEEALWEVKRGDSAGDKERFGELKDGGGEGVKRDGVEKVRELLEH